MADWQNLLQQLGQRAQNNLQNNDDLIGADTTQALDKIRMGNSAQYGPPQPQGPSPEALALSNRIGQGVAGAITPTRVPIATNVASGVAPGIQAGSPMWKQMLETQIKNREADSLNRAKFQALKNKLGG